MNNLVAAVALAAVAVAVLVLLLWSMGAKSDCEDLGGVYVQGQCVEPRQQP